MKVASAGEPGFSPIDNELPLRWWRRLRIVPVHGLGLWRRASVLTAITWLPIVAWAALTGRLQYGGSGESLLHHYGVHARTLLAVPLLIIAEGFLHTAVRGIAAQFVTTGIVPAAERTTFDAIVRHVQRLRDSSLPWILVLAITLGWVMVDVPAPHDDALAWAELADGGLGFGGWWFVYVARPVFLALLVAWLWRVLLITYWLWRVSRLPLALVPSHPDRAGGLGFLEKLPGAFALVTFALSAAIASRWGHDIAVHGATVDQFRVPAAVFVVAWTLIALLPLLALAPTLTATRARALADYSTLVGEQGRLMDRRWIKHEAIGDPEILKAPELGSVADAGSMYAAVAKMRFAPIGKIALLEIFVPLAIPMVVVAALQIPLGQMLMKLIHTVL